MLNTVAFMTKYTANHRLAILARKLLVHSIEGLEIIKEIPSNFFSI